MPNRCSACCMDSGRRSLREKIIPELKSSHMPRKMACETEQNPLGVFKCQLCALTAPYSYKGQQPPDCQSVVLLEECYVLRDPFTPDKGRFLIVGSRCSMCGRLVCVGPPRGPRGPRCYKLLGQDVTLAWMQCGPFSAEDSRSMWLRVFQLNHITWPPLPQGDYTSPTSH
ncbi:cysteine-rich DPF motif domain-containing protein 1 isoform X1 [Moschus berezovskii]|uniref:cysteine-rich DPF motif domain-containing protein 1 isoform X1 n=1 Tax=Moschus berezovskii TaxID=68408 RepID=UPI002444B6AF|nr:cysteine-rich DPF motif domain-containing protein 1 isoform X1 [Moschus berezovskii]